MYARPVRHCQVAAALRDADLALATGPADRSAAHRTYLRNLPPADEDDWTGRLLGDCCRLAAGDLAGGWPAAPPARRLDAAERAATRLREARDLCVMTRLGRMDQDWAIEAADDLRVQAMLDGPGPADDRAERALAVLRSYEQRMAWRVRHGLEPFVVGCQATARRLTLEAACCRTAGERDPVRAATREAAAGLAVLGNILASYPGEDWACAVQWPDAIADLATAERDAADDAPAAARRCRDWCRLAERAAAAWAPGDSPHARDVRGRAELRRLAADRAGR